MNPGELTIGVHVRIDDQWWLPVRFVVSTTLHEESVSGALFIDEEHYVELRSSKGEIRFVSLSNSRSAGKKDKGPCKGIKPYYWKGPVNGTTDVEEGEEGTLLDEQQSGG